MLENLNPFSKKPPVDMNIPQRLMSEEDKAEIKKQKEYEEKIMKVAEEVERVFIREELQVKDLQKVLNYFNVRNNLVFQDVYFSEIQENLSSKKREKEAEDTKKETEREVKKEETTDGNNN